MSNSLGWILWAAVGVIMLATVMYFWPGRKITLPSWMYQNNQDNG